MNDTFRRIAARIAMLAGLALCGCGGGTSQPQPSLPSAAPVALATLVTIPGLTPQPGPLPLTSWSIGGGPGGALAITVTGGTPPIAATIGSPCDGPNPSLIAVRSSPSTFLVYAPSTAQAFASCPIVFSDASNPPQKTTFTALGGQTSTPPDRDPSPSTQGGAA